MITRLQCLVSYPEMLGTDTQTQSYTENLITVTLCSAYAGEGYKKIMWLPKNLKKIVSYTYWHWDAWFPTFCSGDSLKSDGKLFSEWLERDKGMVGFAPMKYNIHNYMQ